MTKQLDFFFDQITSTFRKKTLVVGGKKEAAEMLLVHGRTIRVKRKSYQRNLSLSLRPNGDLAVTAGRTIPVKMISKFVSDSWSWVEQQSKYHQELRAKFPKRKFEPGEYFQILGSDHALKLEIIKSKRPAAKHSAGELIVELPESWMQQPDRLFGGVKTVVRSYYEELGKRILSERVFLYSQRLQLFPQSVSYRCQKTRWGSCSPSKAISLNWRLVAAPLEVIDYVVIHELCHLQYLNHSKSFWRLVEVNSPKWKKIRKWLHENQFAFDFLNETSELHP